MLSSVAIKYRDGAPEVLFCKKTKRSELDTYTLYKTQLCSHLQNRTVLQCLTRFLTRFNKIAISNNKFQMASGQGSHWLIESPTIFSSMCSPPLSDICQFYF